MKQKESTSEITKTIGLRLRQIRRERGYSQEQLAEKAGLHPTYIGQVERGEKNLTLVSLANICVALEYPMEELVAKLTPGIPTEQHARQCFDMIVEQPQKDQEHLKLLIEQVIKYKQQ